MGQTFTQESSWYYLANEPIEPAIAPFYHSTYTINEYLNGNVTENGALTNGKLILQEVNDVYAAPRCPYRNA